MRRSVRKRVILSGIAALATILFVIAEGVPRGDSSLEFRDAYAFATAPGQENGAVFMQIFNHGSEDERIIDVSAPGVAERAELHTNDMSGGIMRMRRIEAIGVPAGGSAVLKSAGDHLMLMGLKNPLRPGEDFIVVLKTERNGEISVRVSVVNPRDAL